MRKIYKEKLIGYGHSITIVSRIEKFLKVDMQDNNPVVWFIYNDELSEKEYVVQSFGTGWSLDNAGEYLGSVQDNEYVWHFFITARREKRPMIHVDWIEELNKPEEEISYTDWLELWNEMAAPVKKSGIRSL